MNNKKKIMITFAIIIYFILFIANFISLNLIITDSLDNMVKKGEIQNDNTFQNLLFTPKIANNDTTPPIIKFIYPQFNNSVITQPTYDIIVNVTDTNPPLPGNVIIQISNYTSFLFNATMNNNSGNLWSFNWYNISLYPNREIYIFKVWARDSSLNGNHNWSEAFYVYIALSRDPPLINLVLYLIAVIVIFSAITVYFNKKALSQSSKKERKSTKEFFEK